MRARALATILVALFIAGLSFSWHQVQAQGPEPEQTLQQLTRMFWGTRGNVVSDGMFFGSRNNVAVDVRVNNQRALRIEPDPISPNFFAGFNGNGGDNGVYGATIGGGGKPGKPNQVQAPFGTIGGGEGNRAGGLEVGGATVGGGSSNGADGVYATIGGGIVNWASGTEATIGGGEGNWNKGAKGTLGGGYRNVVDAYAATVGGGQRNVANGESAVVAGGENNASVGLNTSVSGGRANSAAGSFSSIGGGWRNAATGYGSVIPGGEGNLAEGRYSVALGRMARAQHDGVFIYNSSDEVLSSTDAHQFIVDARGGLRVLLQTGSTTKWCLLEPNSVDWHCVAIAATGQVTVLKSEPELKLEVLEAENAELRRLVASLETRVKTIEAQKR